MATFTLVIGAPCSGKSSYVDKMRGPGDLVVDLDSLQQALGSKRTHGHRKEALHFALMMRESFLRALRGYTPLPRVWYISCWPTVEERALFPEKFYTVRLPTDMEECKRRALEGKRPPETNALIESWFALHASEVTQ